MIVETVEKVNPGPASLRELCSRGVGEQVVRVLWRGQLRFQTIYIPEPVERGLREWLEAVPQCLRQDLLDRSYSLLFSTIGQVTELERRPRDNDQFEPLDRAYKRLEAQYGGWENSGAQSGLGGSFLVISASLLLFL
mgnify:CR=1 FL=1